MLQRREKCVICGGLLEAAYVHKSQPITYCPKAVGTSGDLFADLTYGVCTECDSVQLMTLIDQAILYADPHNITYNTPTWARHHSSFADFIRTSLPPKSQIIEVGGSSGVLAAKLLGDYPDYSIMDFCKSETIPSTVKFIQGNCETYDFPKGAVIIMSHLFEHLYNPCSFIERAAADIIISVPNLERLVEAGNPAVLHAEHTYYYDKDDLIYMFAMHGYELAAFQEFGSHSLFLKFSRSDGALLSCLKKSRSAAILQTFKDRDARFASVEIADGGLIVPAGIYGQLIYMHTQHLGTVAGFLDNDPSKQGRRLYGTPCEIFSFNKLRDMPAPKIYLHAGPYSHEIKEQIYIINPNAIVFEV